MLIDGFTLIAQLINFLILVWLLKRFLYKPILNAIDQREKYIASQIQQADLKKAEAEKELDVNKCMNQEFKKQKQILLNNTMNEINSERIRLIDELHNEIESLRLNYLQTLQTEQQTFSSEIIYRTQKEIFEIVRKTLRDLASADLEEQMANAFLHKLKTLKQEERQLIIAGLERSHNNINIQSSFELSSDTVTKIKDEITGSFGIKPTVKTETDPRLISGIAIMVDGLKVVWSIDEYLLSLKNNLINLIKEKQETK